jgi:hypothetical protein
LYVGGDMCFDKVYLQGADWDEGTHGGQETISNER